ncbi:MAG: aminotransferase class I/II-fold pyridoxal phosphate-dependent enzyme [Chlamydiales bacterium]|nr:aminotransferase class I/II-fold pyridoxal phosphate-dependent enzyme [Chlamydiales bacterium]
MISESSIPKTEADPLFLLQSEFLKDNSANKINLGIGAYKTELGASYLFKSVRKAEENIFKKALPKDYFPILGNDNFIKLFLSKFMPSQFNEGSVWASQSLGGTGALSLAAQLLNSCSITSIALSTPSWVNHKPIFLQGGIEPSFYSYLDLNSMSLEPEKMMRDLSKNKGAVLLQASCHNPSGLDLEESAWIELLKLLKEQSAPIVFDLAYHGFKADIPELPFPVSFCLKQKIPFMLAYSFSKNMGLYGERLGAFVSYHPNTIINEKLKNLSKRLIRSNYSNPPRQASLIAEAIFSSNDLFDLWLKEVNEVKERLNNTRTILYNRLSEAFPGRNFSFMQKQNGMFSLLPISKQEVLTLKEANSVYLPSSGRINIAGLNSSNLDSFIESLKSIWD